MVDKEGKMDKKGMADLESMVDKEGKVDKKGMAD